MKFHSCRMRVCKLKYFSYFARNTTKHTHGPEPDRVMVEKFRKILTHRAATESTDLYTIYWDEASQHSEAALLYTYAAGESAMRKARRKQLPPVPGTIQDVGEVLTKSNLFRVQCTQWSKQRQILSNNARFERIHMPHFCSYEDYGSFR